MPIMKDTGRCHGPSCSSRRSCRAPFTPQGRKPKNEKIWDALDSKIKMSLHCMDGLLKGAECGWQDVNGNLSDHQGGLAIVSLLLPPTNVPPRTALRHKTSREPLLTNRFQHQNTHLLSLLSTCMVIY